MGFVFQLLVCFVFLMYASVGVGACTYHRNIENDFGEPGPVVSTDLTFVDTIECPNSMEVVDTTFWTIATSTIGKKPFNIRFTAGSTADEIDGFSVMLTKWFKLKSNGKNEEIENAMYFGNFFCQILGGTVHECEIGGKSLPASFPKISQIRSFVDSNPAGTPPQMTVLLNIEWDQEEDLVLEFDLGDFDSFDADTMTGKYSKGKTAITFGSTYKWKGDDLRTLKATVHSFDKEDPLQIHLDGSHGSRTLEYEVKLIVDSLGDFVRGVHSRNVNVDADSDGIPDADNDSDGKNDDDDDDDDDDHPSKASGLLLSQTYLLFFGAFAVFALWI